MTIDINNMDDTIPIKTLKKAETVMQIVTFIYRQPLLRIFLIVVLSVMINMALVRTCWVQAERKENMDFICGNIGQIKTPHWLMLYTFASITDNLPQSGAFNSLMAPEKLIDNDEFTQAYPSQRNFDYIIDLFDLYKLERIEIKWGDYGLNGQYINSWILRGKGMDNQWFIVSQGLAPQTEKTIITQNLTVSALQLTAQSRENWIGVYEMKLKGFKY